MYKINSSILKLANTKSNIYRNIILKPINNILSNQLSSIPTPSSRKTKNKKSNSENYFDFNSKATEVLKQIYNALIPIINMNNGYKLYFISSDNDNNDNNKINDNINDITDLQGKELILEAGNRGSYIFRIDKQYQFLIVTSPTSGVYQYNYSIPDGYWLSIIDGHDMRGLVTRDLLRHCTGLPQF
jgi:frataxin-like iron-binding protein CyaY